MATAKAGKPEKGKRPDFNGVPRKVVPMPTLDLRFGAKLRVSPYDALLEALDKASPGSVLQFGDVRARASVAVRARKLGLKVEFAEHETSLYVRLTGYLADSERAKKRLRQGILDVLVKGPRQVHSITHALRELGLDDVDSGMVDAVLKQMEQGALVKRHGDGAWGLR